ncbi:hypothetical protein BDA96_01G276700 [Sorghum bicolor]|uniref:Uncharacterized protein n=1 Tax=Sorghum bicolor TaxID=4558 RepID=A0A921S140_SORBI|nr:hypothetical protein BDA96_01G276700 [Sorghum bicolor]
MVPPAGPTLKTWRSGPTIRSHINDVAMRSHQRHGGEHMALGRGGGGQALFHTNRPSARALPIVSSWKAVRRHRRRLRCAHASASAPVCPCALHNRRPMLELAADPTVVGLMRRREERSSHALPNLSLTQDVLKVATSKKGSDGHGSYILFQGAVGVMDNFLEAV